MRIIVLAAMGFFASCQKPEAAVCGRSPSPGVPTPDFACTSQLAGSMICPGGQVGWGYECTDDQCWALFLDGPCASPFSVMDAGSSADAGLLCSAPIFSTQPDGPCTAGLVGAEICPAGPGSGFGYRCAAAECWLTFADGPCGGGPSCSGTPRDCGAEGQVACRAGLRAICSSGCWVDTGLCSADGGLPDAGIDGGPDGGFFCRGNPAPTGPNAACTASILGASICPAGPGSGFGFQCEDAGCWQFFFDGPCTPREADAGSSCVPSRTCDAGEGQARCEGGLSAACYRGCWVDTDVCGTDGG